MGKKKEAARLSMSLAAAPSLQERLRALQEQTGSEAQLVHHPVKQQKTEPKNHRNAGSKMSRKPQTDKQSTPSLGTASGKKERRKSNEKSPAEPQPQSQPSAEDPALKAPSEKTSERSARPLPPTPSKRSSETPLPDSSILTDPPAPSVTDSSSDGCPSCGALLGPNAKFCVHCGTKVEPKQSSQCEQCGG